MTSIMLMLAYPARPQVNSINPWRKTPILDVTDMLRTPKRQYPKVAESNNTAMWLVVDMERDCPVATVPGSPR